MSKSKALPDSVNNVTPIAQVPVDQVLDPDLRFPSRNPLNQIAQVQFIARLLREDSNLLFLEQVEGFVSSESEFVVPEVTESSVSELH